MSESPKDIRCCVEQLHAQLKVERASFDAHWRDIADYFAPRRARFNRSERTQAGSKRSDKIINSTGLEAANTLASGMATYMTSPARPWLGLVTPDPELTQQDDVSAWLYLVVQRMRHVFSLSNFYNAAQTTYFELGTFGTACMIVDEDDETVFRCTPLTIGSYWLATSHRGVVDTMVRELSMTPRQMLAKFGAENLSRQALDAARSESRQEKYVPVLHMIAPNPDNEPGKRDKAKKAFRSVYIEVGGDEDKVLSLSGYDSMPVMAPRWSLVSDDVYGDCPGMRALGDNRALQLLEKRKLEIIDKLSLPPMVSSPELQVRGATMVPGGINYVSGAHGGSGLQAAYIPPPQALPGIAAEIQQHEQRIMKAFYADLFLMMSELDRREITAREVDERHEEKLLVLGPVVERLEDELLDPLIDRVFDIMQRRGMIPDAPESLQGMDITPEYTSLLAQAQRAVGVGGIERLATYAISLSQADATVMDKLDLDESISSYATMLTVPPKMVRSDEQVKAIRDARAQQQQQAQMAESAKGLQATAAAAKFASQTQTGNGSVLDQILSPQAQAAA